MINFQFIVELIGLTNIHNIVARSLCFWTSTVLI